MTNEVLREPQADAGYVDVAPYLRLLFERWRLIAIVALVVMFATALIDKFWATEWYRSEAVLRPISTSAVEGRIAGMMGGLGGGLVGLGGLASSLGAGTVDADEYLAIMNGFAFNLALAQRHQLSAELLQSLPWYQRLPGRLFPGGDQRWEIYNILQGRFDCFYSQSQGNIGLSFVARSPEDAEKVLGYYIDDLRDLLRAREISGASAAIASLRDEALSTPDPLLRAQLYGLEAKQVQRKKMAQVEADFAFRVLDPPAAPDKKYRPKVTVDSVIAGVLAALATALFLLLRYRPYQAESRSNVFPLPVGMISRRIDPAGREDFHPD